MTAICIYTRICIYIYIDTYRNIYIDIPCYFTRHLTKIKMMLQVKLINSDWVLSWEKMGKPLTPRNGIGDTQAYMQHMPICNHIILFLSPENIQLPKAQIRQSHQTRLSEFYGILVLITEGLLMSACFAEIAMAR